MRIGISNIAWDISEDEQIASLLNRYSIDAIDIAPMKYFPDPEDANSVDIKKVRTWWDERGIEITGMQALMFGTKGFNIFSPIDVQQKMLKHLTEIARIGAGLGATNLVFGSPKNRDRGALAMTDANAMAVSFFQSLGEIGGRYGVTFCLEPNPSCYGANFMLDSVETAGVVSAVDHPAIKLQFDTGASTINAEQPAVVIHEYAHLIGHIHASEPGLVSLGEGTTDHATMGRCLNEAFPDSIVSIEMLSAKTSSHLAAVERALQLAIRHYQGASNVRENI